MVDQAIARTFAFPDIAVPYSHPEYGIARPAYLIAYDLASQKLVNHRLNVRAGCAGTSWRALAGCA